MACGSVATTKAQISQVVLDEQTLIGMLAKLTGQAPEMIYTYNLERGDKARTHGGKRITLAYDYGHARAFLDNGANVTIVQTIRDGVASLELQIGITGGSQSQAEQIRAELEPEYNRLVTVGQTSVVLKRLAALGKLSNVKQTDAGVTARVTLEI